MKNITVSMAEEVTFSVTWESDKTFSQEEAGEYTYTAKLTEENYTFAEGVKMPAITVHLVNQPAMILTQSTDMFYLPLQPTQAKKVQ